MNRDNHRTLYFAGALALLAWLLCRKKESAPAPLVPGGGGGGGAGASASDHGADWPGFPETP